MIENIDKMNGWKIEELPNLVFFQEGPGVRNNQYTDSGVKLLNVANLKDGNVYLDNTDRYISEEEAYGKYSHFLVDEGDLIIASSGIKVEYFDKKMGFAKKEHLPLCMNTSTIRFKTLDKDILDIEYFAYFLKTNYFKKQISRLITGSAQLNFGPSHLKQIKVILPPRDVQKKIVEVLDKAQELIDKRKDQIKALDELVKSRFIEMFGNLKNLETMELSKCANFIDYRGKTPTLSENGIRMINAKSVGNGVFKYIEEYVSEETYNSWMKRGFPEPGDVLFVTEGHTFGNVCRIPESLNKFAMGQRVITLQGNKDIINNVFLVQYMQTNDFKVKIDKYKTGSSAQGIRSKELQKILIPIPKIELQNQFADFVKQVDKLKSQIETSLKELEDNFNSLMQKAFKGELF